MSNTLVPRDSYSSSCGYTRSLATWVIIVIVVIIIVKLLVVAFICIRCARRRKMRAFTPGQNIHMNPAYQRQQALQQQQQQNGYYGQAPYGQAPYGQAPYGQTYVVGGEKGVQTTGVVAPVASHDIEAETAPKSWPVDPAYTANNNNAANATTHTIAVSELPSPAQAHMHGSNGAATGFR